MVLILLLAVQILGVGLHSVAAQPNDSADRILVINSQPYTTEWFNSLNDRFVEEINRLQPAEFKISYERENDRRSRAAPVTAGDRPNAPPMIKVMSPCPAVPSMVIFSASCSEDAACPATSSTIR